MIYRLLQTKYFIRQQMLHNLEVEHFLHKEGMKYMGSYTLNNNDKKELLSMLPNFQLKQFHK